MVGNAYARGLPIALERGDVTIGMIDEAVRRVLTLKTKLGLFERPFPPEADAAEREARLVAGACAGARGRDEIDHAAQERTGPIAAQAAAARCLDRSGGRRRIVLLGAWHAAGKRSRSVSIREALQRGAAAAKLFRSPRAWIVEGDDVTGIAEAVRIARDADVVVLSLGEPEGWTGEAASRGQLESDRAASASLPKPCSTSASRRWRCSRRGAR